MGKIIYVTGGRRSGKSAVAQAMAEGLGGPRVYIATCPVLDDEMRARVEAHRKARQGKEWNTVEEPLALARAMEENPGAGVILVECLTLWVNNILYQAELDGRVARADEAERMMASALEAAARAPGVVIFVSNEVGWGIIPDNPLARLFSDIAGRVNQLAAMKSNEAYLVVSGLSIKIK